jgi:hypothetical protein
MERSLRYDKNRKRIFKGTSAEITAEHTRGVIPGRIYLNSDSGVVMIQKKSGELKILETGNRERNPDALTEPAITGQFTIPPTETTVLTGSGSIQTFVTPNTVITYFWLIGLDVVHVGQTFNTPPMAIVGDTIVVECFTMDDFGNVSNSTFVTLTCGTPLVVRPFRTDFRATGDLCEEGTFYVDPGTDQFGNRRTAIVHSNDLVQISGTLTFDVTTWMNYTVTCDDQYVGQDSNNLCELNVNGIAVNDEHLHLVINAAQVPPDVTSLGIGLGCPVALGEQGTFTVGGATDENGDTITYSVSVSSDAIVLSGQLTGLTDGANVAYQATSDQARALEAFTITIEAEDSTHRSSTKTFNCMLGQSSAAPIVTGLSISLSCPVVIGSDPGTFTVGGATDPEGSAITYDIASSSAYLVLSNNTDVVEGGTVNYTVTDDNAADGENFTITVVAKDDLGVTTSKVFNCAFAANQVPVIAGLNISLVCPVMIGSGPNTFTVGGATDPEGTDITYDVTSNSANFVLSNNIGVVEGGTVTYTPSGDPADNNENFVITVVAKDGDGVTNSKTFNCSLLLGPAAPNTTNVALTGLSCPLETNSSGSFTVGGAVDINGDTVTYDVTVDTAYIVLSNNTDVVEGGTVNWVTTEDPTKGGISFNFTVVAKDPGGLTSTKVIPCSLVTDPSIILNIADLTHNFPATVPETTVGNYSIEGVEATVNGTIYYADYIITTVHGIARTDGTGVPIATTHAQAYSYTYGAFGLSPAIVTVKAVMGTLETITTDINSIITEVVGGPDAGNITLTIPNPVDLCDTGNFVITGATHQTQGEVLTYGIVISPLAITFTPNSNITDGATNSFTVSCNPAMQGNASITVTVTDESGLTDSKVFLETINPGGPQGVMDVHMLGGQFLTPPGNFVVGTAYNYKALGLTDPAGGDIRYTVQSQSGGATWFMPNNQLNDAQGDVTAQTSGVSTVIVRGTSTVSGLYVDGSLSNNFGNPSPPSVGSVNLTTPNPMYAGNTYNWQLSGGSDPAGGNLSVTVVTTNASLWQVSQQIMNASGTCNRASPGGDSVTFRFTSSVTGLSADRTFNRTWFAVNQAPVASNLQLVINNGITPIYINHNYNFTLSGATDSDGDIMTYTVYGTPHGGANYSITDNTEPGGGNVSCPNTGQQSVTIKVTDPDGDYDTKTFYPVWSDPPNQGPTMVSNSQTHNYINTTIIIGATVNIKINSGMASDPDDDANDLRYSISQQNGNTTISPNTNIAPGQNVSVTLTNDVRLHQMTDDWRITVTDPGGLQDSGWVTVTWLLDPEPVPSPNSASYINTMQHNFPATSAINEGHSCKCWGSEIVYRGQTFYPTYKVYSYHNVSETNTSGSSSEQQLVHNQNFGYTYGNSGTADVTIRPFFSNNLQSLNSRLVETNVGFPTMQGQVTISRASNIYAQYNGKPMMLSWNGPGTGVENEWTCRPVMDTTNGNGGMPQSLWIRNDYPNTLTLNKNTNKHYEFACIMMGPQYQDQHNSEVYMGSNVYGTSPRVTWLLGSNDNTTALADPAFKAVRIIVKTGNTSSILYQTPDLIVSTGNKPLIDEHYVRLQNLPANNTFINIELQYKDDLDNNWVRSGGLIKCLSKPFRGNKFSDYVESATRQPNDIRNTFKFTHDLGIHNSFLVHYDGFNFRSYLPYTQGDFPQGSITIQANDGTGPHHVQDSFPGPQAIPTLNAYIGLALQVRVGIPGNDERGIVFIDYSEISLTSNGSFSVPGEDAARDSHDWINVDTNISTPGTYQCGFTITDGNYGREYLFNIHLS